MKHSSRDRLLDEFFRFLEFERNAATRTVENYRHALAEFRTAVATPGWKDLTADHFRRYL